MTTNNQNEATEQQPAPTVSRLCAFSSSTIDSSSYNEKNHDISPNPQNLSTITNRISSRCCRLEQRFVYLNPITGQVSSNALTVRQLCRLLCPSISVTTPSQIFTPQLQILGLVDENNNNNKTQPEAQQHGIDNETETKMSTTTTTETPRYSPDGWTVAALTPILREACTQWYFSFSPKLANDGNTKTSSSRATEGPVTCRQLAQVVSDRFMPSNSSQQQQQQQQQQPLLQNLVVWSPLLQTSAATVPGQDSNMEDATTDFVGVASTETTNQSSSTTIGGWKKLDELPDLLTAMEAFDTTSPLAAAATESPTLAFKTADMAYDASIMTFQTDGLEKKKSIKDDPADQLELSIQEELEAFLSAPVTDNRNDYDDGNDRDANEGADDDNDDGEGYESDGGTHYIKDRSSGNWIEGSTSQSNVKPTKPTKEHKAPSKSNQATPAVADTNEGPTSSHQDAAAAQQRPNKRKRPKFSAKHAKCWIYVSGLPTDTNEEEVTRFFSKAGIIALDPETQQPKVKLYRYNNGTKSSNNQQDHDSNAQRKQQKEDPSDHSHRSSGQLKGDASICYARPESVDLAVQILDEAMFRPPTSSTNGMAVVRVERAKFEQHGETFDERRKRLATSRTKQKVVRLAALQAMDWDDEGDVNGRISGGRKGLRIIVLKHVFDPMKVKKSKRTRNKNQCNDDNDDDDDEEEDGWELQVEHHVRQTCEQFGPVEKITIFSKNPHGVVVVKFLQPSAATEAVQHYNHHDIMGPHGGGWSDDRKIEASYWDGVTDFTVRNEEQEQKEMERRQDEFGNWLEHQELPAEFQLRVEEN